MGSQLMASSLKVLILNSNPLQ